MAKIELQNKTKSKIPPLVRWQRWTSQIVKLPDNWIVEVVVVGKQRIKTLNSHYRQKNEVTDVLSFPVFPRLPAKLPAGENTLGTVVICLPQAQKQAQKAGHSLETELKILYQHGLKHLLGQHHR